MVGSGSLTVGGQERWLAEVGKLVHLYGKLSALSFLLVEAEAAS